MAVGEMSQRTRWGLNAPCCHVVNAQTPARFDPGISSWRARDRCAQSMFEMFAAVLFVSLNDWRRPRCPSVGQWLKSGMAQPKGGMVCDHRRGGDRSACIVMSPGREAEPNVQDGFIVNKCLEPRALVAFKTCRIHKKREMHWEAGSCQANPPLTLTCEKVRPREENLAVAHTTAWRHSQNWGPGPPPTKPVLLSAGSGGTAW